ncbi:MAG: peptidoglycan DD-metalloendopeptidase family protein [Bacteroidetes bacterium]|nr:peptidoglycan DD-metalloendopeptidase family protein [Bacteroidota bacterium]MBU1372816.1 peptidoglycan DD-metalloendopeptidase family protein [Bacteroidota bacterium]MBU1485545.1 peptidoglycan DD-metalloendopeptidase family protein [Bacteroidota bacterium]MBU1760084.1 peptidoglycan DD-metalloendopeptidase family protein [Bacteroidota bacterium]MBU2046860.1 peptidoglycan DD-metalloendopeptidase family protein [Bacteroidota bacterium]
MNSAQNINDLLKKHQSDFYPVVDFSATSDKIIPLDFTAANTDLKAEIIGDTTLFSQYIDKQLSSAKAKFGIGGYFEHRTVYARSEHFSSSEGEPRRLHLGVDIWGIALTPIYAFMDAKVHSFAFNNNFGDYGATIILEHELERVTFYSLYGHLSLKNLGGLTSGKRINKGEQFCDFGIAEENGFWPPHLHFQLMCDMEGLNGDYPGVAKFSEFDLWKSKIPDPNIILNWN